jgi:hypothetical protein
MKKLWALDIPGLPLRAFQPRLGGMCLYGGGGSNDGPGGTDTRDEGLSYSDMYGGTSGSGVDYEALAEASRIASGQTALNDVRAAQEIASDMVSMGYTPIDISTISSSAEGDYGASVFGAIEKANAGQPLSTGELNALAGAGLGSMVLGVGRTVDTALADIAYEEEVAKQAEAAKQREIAHRERIRAMAQPVAKAPAPVDESGPGGVGVSEERTVDYGVPLASEGAAPTERTASPSFWSRFGRVSAPAPVTVEEVEELPDDLVGEKLNPAEEAYSSAYLAARAAGASAEDARAAGDRAYDTFINDISTGASSGMAQEISPPDLSGRMPDTLVDIVSEVASRSYDEAYSAAVGRGASPADANAAGQRAMEAVYGGALGLGTVSPGEREESDVGYVGGPLNQLGDVSRLEVEQNPFDTGRGVVFEDVTRPSGGGVATVDTGVEEPLGPAPEGFTGPPDDRTGAPPEGFTGPPEYLSEEAANRPARETGWQVDDQGRAYYVDDRGVRMSPAGVALDPEEERWGSTPAREPGTLPANLGGTSFAPPMEGLGLLPQEFEELRLGGDRGQQGLSMGDIFLKDFEDRLSYEPTGQAGASGWTPDTMPREGDPGFMGPVQAPGGALPSGAAGAASGALPGALPGTSMSPDLESRVFDILDKVRDTYAYRDGPRSTTGLSRSDLQALVDAGLGKYDLSESQTIDQALASLKTGQYLEQNMPSIIGMLAGPVPQIVVESIFAMKEGYKPSSIVGTIVSSVIGSAIQMVTGIAVPGQAVQDLAQGNVGKAAFGVGVTNVAARLGLPVGTVNAALSGNLGAAAANQMLSEVVMESAKTMGADPGLIATIAVKSGLGQSAFEKIAGAINDNSIVRGINDFMGEISSGIKGFGIDTGLGEALSSRQGAVTAGDASGGYDGSYGGSNYESEQAGLIADAIQGGQPKKKLPRWSDLFFSNLARDMGASFAGPPPVDRGELDDLEESLSIANAYGDPSRRQDVLDPLGGVSANLGDGALVAGDVSPGDIFGGGDDSASQQAMKKAVADYIRISAEMKAPGFSIDDQGILRVRDPDLDVTHLFSSDGTPIGSEPFVQIGGPREETSQDVIKFLDVPYISNLFGDRRQKIDRRLAGTEGQDRMSEEEYRALFGSGQSASPPTTGTGQAVFGDVSGTFGSKADALAAFPGLSLVSKDTGTGDETYENQGFTIIAKADGSVTATPKDQPTVTVDLVAPTTVAPPPPDPSTDLPPPVVTPEDLVTSPPPPEPDPADALAPPSQQDPTAPGQVTDQTQQQPTSQQPPVTQEPSTQPTTSLTTQDVQKIVQDALTANPSLTQQQVQDIVNQAMQGLPPGLTSQDVSKAISDAISGLPQSPTAQDIDSAISRAMEGVATKSELTDLERALAQAIADARSSGAEGDAALRQGLDALAGNLGTTKDSVLAQLGTTEQALRQDFAAQLGGVQTELAGLGSSLSQAIADARAAGLQGDAALQAGLDALSGSLGTTKAELLAELGTTEQALRTQFDTALGGVQSTLSGQLGDLRQETQSQYAALTAAQQAEVQNRISQGQSLEAAINAVAAGVEQRLTDVQSGLTQQIGGVEERLGTRVNELMQQGFDYQTATNQALKEITGSIETLSGQQTALGEQTQQALSGVEGRLNDRVNELMRQGAGYQEATDQALRELTGTIGDVRSEISSGLSGVRGDLSQQYDALTASQKAEVDARIKQGEDLSKAIGDVRSGLTEQIAGVQQGVTTQVGDLDTRLNTRIDELVTQGSTFQDATTQALGELRGGLTGLSEAQQAAEEAEKERVRLQLQQQAQGQMLSTASGFQSRPSGVVEQYKASFLDPFIVGGEAPEFKSPLAGFTQSAITGGFLPSAPSQKRVDATSGDPEYFRAAEIAGIAPPLQIYDPTQEFKGLFGFRQGGLVPLMAKGGTRYGENAHGALRVLEHSGKHRVDYRQGDAVTGIGDGQSDDIPAMLADGEFVIPADVVAALGNGSTKAGSDKLYDMMHSIRRHHRSAGPKDLPPPAKSPLEYIKPRRRAK